MPRKHTCIFEAEKCVVSFAVPPARDCEVGRCFPMDPRIQTTTHSIHKRRRGHWLSRIILEYPGAVALQYHFVNVFYRVESRNSLIFHSYLFFAKYNQHFFFSSEFVRTVLSVQLNTVWAWANFGFSQFFQLFLSIRNYVLPMSALCVLKPLER